MLLCLHEEHAVAIAHGYAKVTGTPAGARSLHSNVGLMHATMAIFNAWCDRVPMLRARRDRARSSRRAPAVDRLDPHRADQGALVRDYMKWDDQPASSAAALEALLRARQLAHTAPPRTDLRLSRRRLQEAKLAGAAADAGLSRSAGRRAAVRRARCADARERSRGRAAAADDGPHVARRRAWDARVALAEALGALVLTD